MGKAPETYVRLTKADRKVLREAVDRASRHWHSEMVNYEVIAGSRDGAWPISGKRAGGKARALRSRLAGLERAVAKLAI